MNPKENVIIKENNKLVRVGLITRVENYKDYYPFNFRHIINDSYRKIFDELDVLVIPIISEKNLDEISELCDFLILPGSSIGVDPKHYNDVPFPGKKYKYDEYSFDKKIIDMFVNKGKPILGICGGMQTLNVYFGGDLNQNILNHKLYDNSFHNINIEKNSFISNVFKSTNTKVNSYHRQCIRKLAPGFKVTAISDDEIIEAVECNNIVGVQWHPEALNDINFFKTFIETYIQK